MHNLYFYHDHSIPNLLFLYGGILINVNAFSMIIICIQFCSCIFSLSFNFSELIILLHSIVQSIQRNFFFLYLLQILSCSIYFYIFYEYIYLHLFTYLHDAIFFLSMLNLVYFVYIHSTKITWVNSSLYLSYYEVLIM